MQIIPKQVYQIDGVVPGVLVSVSGKQNKGDITDPISDPGISAFQPTGRISTEEHLRRGGAGSTTLFELLEEDFAQDDVVFVFEDGGEDDGHSVRFRFDEHGFIVSVVDDGRLMTFFFFLLELEISERRKLIIKIKHLFQFSFTPNFSPFKNGRKAMPFE